jgi:phage-related protein
MNNEAIVEAARNYADTKVGDHDSISPEARVVWQLVYNSFLDAISFIQDQPTPVFEKPTQGSGVYCEGIVSFD